MAKVEVEKVSRWLESLADSCLAPNCDRCSHSRELAKLVRDGALSKNVPIAAGKGSFCPKAEKLLTPEFLAECKAEGLPNPIEYVHGFVSWAKEEQILKRDWFEFFKIILRKKKAAKPKQQQTLQTPEKKLSAEERQAIVNRMLDANKKGNTGTAQ